MVAGEISRKITELLEADSVFGVPNDNQYLAAVSKLIADKSEEHGSEAEQVKQDVLNVAKREAMDAQRPELAKRIIMLGSDLSKPRAIGTYGVEGYNMVAGEISRKITELLEADGVFGVPNDNQYLVAVSKLIADGSEEQGSEAEQVKQDVLQFAMYEAVDAQLPELVKSLIKLGYDPKKTPPIETYGVGGYNALFQAVNPEREKGNNTEIVNRLLNAGANPCAVLDDGETSVLKYALPIQGVNEMNQKMIYKIIWWAVSKAAADVGSADEPQGPSVRGLAEREAMDTQFPDLADRIITRGSDLSKPPAPETYGVESYNMVAGEISRKITELLEADGVFGVPNDNQYLAAVSKLIADYSEEQGSETEQVKQDVLQFAMYEAVDVQLPELVKSLIKLGYDPKKTPPLETYFVGGYNALFQAVNPYREKGNNTEIVKALLEAGANPCAVLDDGKTSVLKYALPIEGVSQISQRMIYKIICQAVSKAAADVSSSDEPPRPAVRRLAKERQRNGVVRT